MEKLWLALAYANCAWMLVINLRESYRKGWLSGDIRWSITNLVLIIIVSHLL